MIRRFTTRLASGLLAATTWLAGAANAETAAPLPVEAFARLPQAQGVAISPDGTWFAALMNRGSRTRAVANSLDGNAPLQLLLDTDNHEFRLAGVRWVSNQRLVLTMQFSSWRAGVVFTETRLFAVDRDGGHPLMLTQPASAMPAQLQGQVVDWLPGDGHHLLLQAPIDPSDASPGVYRVDVDTGERSPVHGRRFRVMHWMTDLQHRVRVGIQQVGTQIEVLVCDPDGENWRSAWSYELFDRAAVRPLGFAPDRQRLYVLAERDDRQAVFEVDLRDPALARRLVLGLDGTDIGGELMRDPVSGEAIGIRAGRVDDAAAFYWEPTAQALMKSIDAALPGRQNRLLQFSADGSRYLLFSDGNGIAGQFMVGDRAKGTLGLVSKQYPELPATALVPKQRLTLTTRDGLTLPVYLTLPAGSDGGKLPTVVLPHGGPIASDGIGFDPLVEFLANRGYAVLQPQFRGSTGEGVAHRNSGLQRWGREMQDDITDALKWLVARGTADPSRVCIVGASYGGYAALMGGATTPELYRCVVSIAGVADLPALAATRARFVNGSADFERQIGSPRRDGERLAETSPTRLAARFAAPVLLLHGSADSTVPFAQGQRMADALKAAGKTVRFVPLPGADHQLGAQPDRVRVYRELGDFLAEQLAPPADAVAAH